MTLDQLLGVAGSGLILGSYLALQLGRLRPDQLLWPLANAVGAALVLWSLMHKFNLAAFLLESAWLLISFVGLVRLLRR